MRFVRGSQYITRQLTQPVHQETAYFVRGSYSFSRGMSGSSLLMMLSLVMPSASA